MKIGLENYLLETTFFDFKSDRIQSLVSNHKLSDLTSIESAVHLYYVVRDGWRYDAYNISLDPKDYRASSIASKDSAHCIDKSTLLIACLRAIGIPARLELAKIKNHLAVERLIELIGTDELVPHGFVSMYLNEKWVKASPAFNKELCALYNVPPIEFDGVHDSIFQKFDRDGNVFMEYLEYYGDFDDVPLEFIFNKWKQHYPRLHEWGNHRN